MDFSKLKNLMNDFVDDGYTPGNTVLVYVDNKEAFNYSSGYSDFSKRKIMTGNEYFNLWSCSKITTVVAGLQLLEKGKFLLTDPLYEYMPEFKDMYVKKEDGQLIKATKNITVQNLFNMTAGFTYDTDSKAFEKAKKLTNGKMNTDVVIKCLAEEPLAFEPGERFLYSLCHDVLGRFVEVVSGMKFRDYVKENIFEPLGMSCSTYHPDAEIKSKMATQYKFIPDGSGDEFDLVEAQKNGCAKNGVFVDVGVENEYIFGDEYDSGGAGIISTVTDYIKLAAALADYGKGLNGARILSKTSVELMRKNSLNEQQLKTYDWQQLKGYGYGLGVRTMLDIAEAGAISRAGEFGWGGAAGATVIVDPEIGLSAVYLKHTLNPREEYYMPRLRNVLYSCLND